MACDDYRMEKSTVSQWNTGLAINLISNVISLAVGAAFTYFTHSGSLWVTPILWGGMAWLITFCSIIAIRMSRHIPKRGEAIDTTNVHRRIREWLDKFNLTVKNVNTDDSHFFFIVTTDGGKVVSVSRTKGQFSDYILVKGLITAGDAEKEVLNTLNEDEKNSLRLAIYLELTRAVMGYKTDSDILENLTIFRRVPITMKLSEEEIFRMMWEVEAMIGSIFTVGGIAAHRHKIQSHSETH